MNKKYLPGELALCIVLIINSLGVCLMAKSGFGIFNDFICAICIQ